MNLITISYFESFTKHIKDISLPEPMEMIADGKVKNTVEQARNHLKVGDKDSYDKVKKSLPGVTFAGTFQGGRKSSRVNAYSKLVILDLDHIDADVKEVKQKAVNDSHTLATFVSPSNKGLKVLVHVSSEVEDHEFAFRQVAEYYEQLLGISVDTSGKDLARLCFLSYDPDLYVNYDSKIFAIDTSAAAQVPMQQFLDIYNRAVNLTKRSRSFREGERNEFVHLLAHNSNRGGIPMDIARRLIQKSYGYDEGEVNSTIDSAYSHGEEHGVGFNEGEQESRLQRVEGFLGQRYDFRMNIVSGNLEFRQSGESSFRPLTDYVENSIFRALEREGTGISSNKLATLLRSDFADCYDPFAVYLNNLPEWDGNDHVEALAKTVSTTNDSYWHWIFKKWLVALVAGLVRENVVNHGVLVIIGGQGVGKTTWIERLVPSDLKNNLYSGTINTSNKDTLMHLSECMLINMDELENLNRSEIGELKQLITKSTIRARKVYGRNNERLIRRASFAGSVNNPNFLNDPSGSRRFLVAEVVSIDLEARCNLDYIYAQAYHLFREGYQYWFDRDEIARISIENSKYQAQSVEEELIQTWFQPAIKGSHTHIISASEIANIIAERSKYQLSQYSPVRVGKILSKLGYSQIKHQGTYRYPVKLKEYSDVDMVQKGIPIKQDVEAPL